MATADPLELLRNKNNISKTYLSDKWAPVCGTALGFMVATLTNYFNRRPLWSGIQRYAILGSLFGGVSYWLDKRRDAYYAERDAILMHYIELHPEDFPPIGVIVLSEKSLMDKFNIERKKFADVLLRWDPIR